MTDVDALTKMVMFKCRESGHPVTEIQSSFVLKTMCNPGIHINSHQSILPRRRNNQRTGTDTSQCNCRQTL